MSKPKGPQGNDLYRSAHAFHRAGRELITRWRKDMNEAFYQFPIAVNLALAGELYLKALLYRDEARRVRGHELGRLFKQLAAPTRKQIKSAFESDVAGNPHLATIEQLDPEFPFELTSVLEASDKSFEVWSYALEAGPALKRFYGLDVLCRVLDEHIVGLEPSWKIGV